MEEGELPISFGAAGGFGDNIKGILLRLSESCFLFKFFHLQISKFGQNPSQSEKGTGCNDHAEGGEPVDLGSLSFHAH